MDLNSLNSRVFRNPFVLQNKMLRTRFSTELRKTHTKIGGLKIFVKRGRIPCPIPYTGGGGPLVVIGVQRGGDWGPKVR